MPGVQTTAKKESGPVYGAGRGRVWGSRRSTGFNAGNPFDGSFRMRSGQGAEYLKNRAAEIDRKLKRIRDRLSRMKANK